VGFGTPFTVAVAGTTLSGHRWPAPAPTVVFLHAGVADQRCWYDVIDVLEGRIDAVTYDRRGFGRSILGEPGFRHVDDLAAVVDAVGGGPVVLVGNSMGGELALDFALTAAERVAAMLLIAPAVSGAPELGTIDPATMVLADRLERAEADGDRDQVARLETWLWLDGPGQPEGRVSGAPRRLAEEMSRQVLAHAAPEGSGGSGLDAWSQLATIRTPTLVVAGELDVPLLIEQSRRVSGSLADGAFRLLPGTAHLPSLDQPKAVAELVEEVASRLSTG
jgi:pimeloyl-ACP methyl ester carboxylesterase